MTTELRDQHGEINSFAGWGGFIKNHWTEWAENHGVVLEHQRLNRTSGKRTWRTSRNSPNFAREIEILNRFIDGPTHEWLKKRCGYYNYLPISEYKRKFGGKLPDWAKTFKDRGISAGMHIDALGWSVIKVPNEQGAKPGKFRTIERERFISTIDKKKVLVERLIDVKGKCKRVTLITDINTWPNIRQEDLRFGSWTVTLKRERKSSDLLFAVSGYQRILRKPQPWGNYLSEYVAQY